MQNISFVLADVIVQTKWEQHWLLLCGVVAAYVRLKIDVKAWCEDSAQDVHIRQVTISVKCEDNLAQ